MVPPSTLLVAVALAVPAVAPRGAGRPSPAAAVSGLTQQTVPSQVWRDVLAAGQSAIPHLEKLLGDANDLVRARAAVALYRLGRAGALDTLSSLLSSHSLAARREAHQALQAFVGAALDFDPAAPAPVRSEAITRWRAWWDANRQAAVAQRPMSRLFATVLAVDPAQDLVAVSLAARHGAAKGMRMTVRRGDAPVCELHIVGPAGSGSIARIIELSQRMPPHVGDHCFCIKD